MVTGWAPLSMASLIYSKRQPLVKIKIEICSYNPILSTKSALDLGDRSGPDETLVRVYHRGGLTQATYMRIYTLWFPLSMQHETVEHTLNSQIHVYQSCIGY